MDKPQYIKDLESLPELNREKFIANLNFFDSFKYLTDALTPISAITDEANRLYALTQDENINSIQLLEAIREADPSPQVIVFLIITAMNKTKEEIKNQKRESFVPIRKKGVTANKKKAEACNAYIKKADEDLLNNPITARWTLDQRAGYIAEQMKSQGYKQTNGKYYSVATIKTKITGKKLHNDSQ